MLYDVNVRAVARVEGEYLESMDVPSPWEVYDHDGDVVRCDTTVRVEAETPGEARGRAIADAPGVAIPGYVVGPDIKLWTDDGIGITPVPAAGPGGP